MYFFWLRRRLLKTNHVRLRSDIQQFVTHGDALKLTWPMPITLFDATSRSSLPKNHEWACIGPVFWGHKPSVHMTHKRHDYNCDTTTIRLRSDYASDYGDFTRIMALYKLYYLLTYLLTTYCARLLHSSRFDASKKWTRQFFVVVLS